MDEAYTQLEDEHTLYMHLLKRQHTLFENISKLI